MVTYANRFVAHKDPVLTVSNASNGVSAALNATFRNCIFWGENGLVENEVIVLKEGNLPFNLVFDANLWKVQATPSAITSATGIINNQPPLFDSINTSTGYYDFRLKSDSPAINKGVNTSIPTDLDGKNRSIGLPDLGCFEKQ